MAIDNYIKLDQFLKVMNLVESGGHAKLLIQTGEVEVNGESELRRGRKLIHGDKVTIFGETYFVEITPSDINPADL
jgi:ribosome-associated protein